MKKFEYSARLFFSNNWLKLHGYALIRSSDFNPHSRVGSDIMRSQMYSLI